MPRGCSTSRGRSATSPVISTRSSPRSTAPASRRIRRPGPLPAPREIPRAAFPRALHPLAVSLDELALEPQRPDWAGGLRESWERGEDAAQERLRAFIRDGLSGYASDRDRPDIEGTSAASPRICASARSHPARRSMPRVRPLLAASIRATTTRFAPEIGWRDFSYQLLCCAWPDCGAEHEPPVRRLSLARGLMPRFAPGSGAAPAIRLSMPACVSSGTQASCIIGVRMIVASFLIKHLLIDWRAGEQWFWDTLVDADPANNPAGWQWVAGSGADAQPYYRIFNPMTQGEKFDPKGAYVRHWVPEIAGLSDRVIHRPWEAKSDMLDAAGIALGETYPEPIVIHEEARKRALAAFETIKRGRD